MDALEVMGKVPRKGGCRWVGAGRGEGGGDAVVQSACVGVACVPWRARGLRACRGVRGGSRACRGRESQERLLRATAASERG